MMTLTYKYRTCQDKVEGNLTVTGADNDSCDIQLSYTTGIPIKFSLATVAAGCKSIPGFANALVQYKAQ